MNRKTGMVLSNLFIALLLAVVYWLTLYPFETRTVIERDLNYPQGVWVFYEDAFADPYQTSASKTEAVHLIETRLKQGQLALESGLYSLMGSVPKIYISNSLLELGLIRLDEGRFSDRSGTLLVQRGGPYALGESTPEGSVAGVAEILWSQLYITDAVMLEGIGDSLANLPSSDGLRFYLRSGSETERERVLEAVQTYTGATYTAQPLYEFLAGDTFALEARQARLQRLAAVFLLACTLLTLYAGVTRRWFEEREVYRVERILGRSHSYFLRRWLAVSLGQWVWGALLCTLFFLVLAALRGQAVVTVASSLLPWGVSLVLFGTLTALVFALASSRFALSRTTLDTRQTWLGSLVPMAISFVVVFGVTYLFTDTLVQYVESESAVRALGADQVLAMTTPAAQKTFTQKDCEELEVTSCAAFDIADAYLWSPEMGLPITVIENDEVLSKTFRFVPEDAPALRITLLEGRFPAANAKEAVITAQALARVRETVPDFGIGSALDLGYHMVGVVQTPPEADIGVFESIYQAAVFVRQDVDIPDVLGELFAPPFVKSGLALQVSERDDLDAIKTQVRQNLRNTEFIQPAAYAQTFAASIQVSLLRLVGLFTLALLLTGAAYWHFISVTLAKRTMELSIWRLLGMNLRTLSRRLQRELLPLPLLSGILACGLGSLLLFSGYRAAVAPYALLCGLTATALLTGLYSYLIYRSVRAMQTQEVDTLYRKAL